MVHLFINRVNLFNIDPEGEVTDSLAGEEHNILVKYFQIILKKEEWKDGWFTSVAYRWVYLSKKLELYRSK